jgi:hypothetical protein
MEFFVDDSSDKENDRLTEFHLELNQQCGGGNRITAMCINPNCLRALICPSPLC